MLAAIDWTGLFGICAVGAVLVVIHQIVAHYRPDWVKPATKPTPKPQQTPSPPLSPEAYYLRILVFMVFGGCFGYLAWYAFAVISQQPL